MKRILLRMLLLPFSIMVRFISLSAGVNLVMEIIDRATRSLEPSEKLHFLLELDNRLYHWQSRAARAYGDGVHPKHRHIGYHEFFIRNIGPGERVLDIGCGIGVMAYDLVNRIEDIRVTGLEIDSESVEYAKKHYMHSRLDFIQGDILGGFPAGEFDVVTLSNVLEHIEDRVGLLSRIRESIAPDRILLRVPLFERDWRVPLKKELGLDHRLDPTHYTEYTRESFDLELREAGLSVSHKEIRWGEIWAVVKPLHGKKTR